MSKEVYRKIESINFSKELLELFPSQAPSSLWVLPVRGVTWSDWGSEQRIVSVLEKESSPRSVFDLPGSYASGSGGIERGLKATGGILWT